MKFEAGKKYEITQEWVDCDGVKQTVITSGYYRSKKNAFECKPFDVKADGEDIVSVREIQPKKRKSSNSVYRSEMALWFQSTGEL